MRRTSLATLVTCVVALCATSVAFAGNAGFLPASPHSPNAHRVTDAFIVVAIFTGIVFLGVEGALIAFIVKYRRGKRARTAEGPQIHGATRLEIIWTILPVVILALIGAFVFYKLPGISNTPVASGSPNEVTITVEGHQFYWRFVYPNHAVSINRMVAPADEVVNLRIVGETWDVNHSWWAPELGGKLDAIPGKVNKTWFKAPAGTYEVRCAELCGIQHAVMLGQVDVVPRAQYAAFISNRRSSTNLRPLGKEEFEGACMSCHRLDHAYIGPALGGNPLLGDVKGLTTLLRNGGIRMPAVGKNWSAKQIDALVAYTKTLPKAGG